MNVAQKLPAKATHAPEPQAYLPLVEAMAKRLLRRLPEHLELNELIGAGVIGLMEALKRFDPSRKTAFKGYAAYRIRGAMLDELRRRDVMARDARTEAKKLETRIVKLRQNLGRSPEHEEVAHFLGVDSEALGVTLLRLLPVHVFSLEDEGQLSPQAHGLSQFEDFAVKQRRQRLKLALAQLSKRAQQVLHLYYQEELTLKEIGEVMGVTESRICQIMSRATLELRGLMQPGESP